MHGCMECVQIAYEGGKGYNIFFLPKKENFLLNFWPLLLESRTWEFRFTVHHFNQ